MTHEVRVKLRGGLIMRYVEVKTQKKKEHNTYTTHICCCKGTDIFF